MIVARLFHYVDEHQTDWHRFVQLITYAYNAQGHRSVGTTPFCFLGSHHSLGPAVRDLSLSIPTDMSTLPEPWSFWKRFSRKLATLRTRTNRAFKTLKHAITGTLINQITSLQRSYTTNTYFSITPLNSSLHSLVSSTSCNRNYCHKLTDHFE